MLKKSLHAAGWIVVGMVLMGLIVLHIMPSMMLITHKSNLTYDETVTALSEAITKKQGWRVVAVNDYQKNTSLFRPIEQVGSINVCNPHYASMILADDKNRAVTSFMPLAVGVYEDKNEQVYISQLNVGLLGKMFGGTIAEVMGMAGKDLNDAVVSVTASKGHG